MATLTIDFKKFARMSITPDNDTPLRISVFRDADCDSVVIASAKSHPAEGNIPYSIKLRHDEIPVEESIPEVSIYLYSSGVPYIAYPKSRSIGIYEVNPNDCDFKFNEDMYISDSDKIINRSSQLYAKNDTGRAFRICLNKFGSTCTAHNIFETVAAMDEHANSISIASLSH